MSGKETGSSLSVEHSEGVIYCMKLPLLTQDIVDEVVEIYGQVALGRATLDPDLHHIRIEEVQDLAISVMDVVERRFGSIATGHSKLMIRRMPKLTPDQLIHFEFNPNLGRDPLERAKTLAEDIGRRFERSTDELLVSRSLAISFPRHPFG